MIKNCENVVELYTPKIQCCNGYDTKFKDELDYIGFH